MARRRREHSAQERRELWERWKRGESISEIGRALDRAPGTIDCTIRVHLAETLGVVLPGRALMNRGGAHLRLGLLDEAAADYAAVVQYGWNTRSRETAGGLMGLGSVYCERGDVAFARGALEQALPLAEKAGDV